MRDADLKLLRSLEQITNRIVGGHDLDETLRSIVVALTEILHADRCSILLKTSAGQMRMRAAKGIPTSILERTVVRVGEGIAGRVAESGQARLLCGLEPIEEAAEKFRYASDSAICAPLNLRGEVLGVINVNHKRLSEDGEFLEFDQDDLLLARVLANQSAIAIADAQALETAREHERLKRTHSILEERIGDLEGQALALEVVSQVTDRVVSSGTLEEVLDEIIRNTTGLLQAERGSVMLIEPGGEEMRMHAAVGIEEEVVHRARAEVGVGIAGGVAQTGEAMLIEDIAREVNDADAPVDRRQQYRNESAICVPLKIKGEILGVLNLNDRLDDRCFRSEDLFVAQVVANQAAVAITNSRLLQRSVEAAGVQRALELAREIQRSFLPDLPELRGFDIAGYSESCDETGGDYIDYGPHSDASGQATDRLFLAIGDVSGHGVGSALIMATSRAFLRALLTQSDDLAEVFERLNRLVGRDVQRGQFMTLFAGIADPVAGTLTYTSAGHDPALLWRAGQATVEELGATGPPVGVVPDGAFPTEQVEVGPGDLLVLTTDGVWEPTSPSGESFGRERLKEVVLASASRSPEQVVEAIHREVLGFRGTTRLRDDFSLVVLRIDGAPASRGS